MGKKGKSADEKASIILSIYQEAKEPFNLAEIQKAASGRGVVLDSVKDINKSLCDDSKVQTDKIGSGNFFWSFPSKQYQDRVVEKDKHQRHLEAMNAANQSMRELLEAEQANRCAEGRPAKLRRLVEQREKEHVLDQTLEANKKNDPEEIARVAKAAQLCKTAADRWTDNTWALKTFLVKKQSLSGKDVDKMLGLKDDYDYPSMPSAKKSKAGKGGGPKK